MRDDTSELTTFILTRNFFWKRDIAKLISSIFYNQVFESGFVHCDPHPANVLVREHPQKQGKPQVVLVDHCLYKELQDDFRLTYAALWKGLLMADLVGIKVSCHELGIKDMVCIHRYPRRSCTHLVVFSTLFLPRC